MRVIGRASSGQSSKEEGTSKLQNLSFKLQSKSTQKNNGRFSAISQPRLFPDAGSVDRLPWHGHSKHMGSDAQSGIGRQPHCEKAGLALGSSHKPRVRPDPGFLAFARNRD